MRPLREITHLENIELEFKVIKLDAKRNNVVVSRRAVMESSNSAEREELLANLEEGASLKVLLKILLIMVPSLISVVLTASCTLLICHGSVLHPSEMISVGDEIDVKVLKFDHERNRVSLGMKQMGEDPWGDIKGRYPKGARTKAKVTNLTDYGCFAELEDGVEGLVHVSEMDWTNKNVHPSKIVDLGQEVDVMVLEIDEERRRILGIKQCYTNPWDDFASSKAKGDKVSGNIKSITDFGIFIGLEGGIDGLVHLSDISWNESGEEAVRNFKKGEEVETVVLSIDAERERISLGIKQLSDDPFNNYVSENDKGSIVTGTVKDVEAKFAVIDLGNDIEATLKVSELSRERVDDARNELNVGDEVEAKIVNVDRKNREISLSIKAKDVSDEKAAVKAHKNSEAASATPATIGDLIKAQMDK